MATPTYDAIVVGSGISGGWAAKELTEKGLKVLLLERGRNIEQSGLRERAEGAVGDAASRQAITQARATTHPVLRRDYMLNEVNVGLTGPTKPTVPTSRKSRSIGFAAITSADARSCGAARVTAGAISISRPMRTRASRSTGRSVTRTSRRGTTTSRRFAGISGSKEGLPQLPDGQFLPPMELNCVEKDVAARIKKHYNDARRLIIGRVANITAAAQRPRELPVSQQVLARLSRSARISARSRPRCPLRVKTGNLTLRPFSIVTQRALRQGHAAGDAASKCSMPRRARPTSSTRRSFSSAPRRSTPRGC